MKLRRKIFRSKLFKDLRMELYKNGFDQGYIEKTMEEYVCDCPEDKRIDTHEVTDEGRVFGKICTLCGMFYKD